MESKVTLKFYEGDSGVGVEEFSEPEKEQLDKVITNTESTVFAWRIGENFTPEQAGALLSRYSRTTLTSRRLFIKEFLPNKDRGREFFESWLIDYGDDSIQEMSGALPLSCEFVSNVAAKEIEDSRMGSYIEKSSRYVSFDKKLPNGEYMFYKDKDILDKGFGDRYLDLMRSLFDSYSKNTQAMFEYLKDLNKFEDQGFKLGEFVVKPTEVNKQIEEKYGITVEDLKKAYENAVKANALDFVRDYLPMATLTHIGINMNARSYENMMIKLLASPLNECRFIGENIYTELNKLVPSLVRRVHEKHGIEYINFMKEKNRVVDAHVSGIDKSDDINDDPVTLADYTGIGTSKPDEKAQINIASIILYRSGGFSIGSSIQKATSMGELGRRELIRKYVGQRANRRQKPGRAFENVDYLFGFKGRVGIYRDLQRHRIGTQERQRFTVKLGYDMRKEYREIGIDSDYKSKMQEVIELYNKINETMPYQAQYVVTYGFNTRWYYHLNARQLFHFSELRTTPGGHPDYRKLVQDAYKKVSTVHPSVTEHMNYINMNSKELGRLESEIRIAMKKKAAEKK